MPTAASLTYLAVSRLLVRDFSRDTMQPCATQSLITNTSSPHIKVSLNAKTLLKPLFMAQIYDYLISQSIAKSRVSTKEPPTAVIHREELTYGDHK